MSDCNKPKTNGCGCPPPVIIPGEINGPAGPAGAQGATGNSGTNGIDGTNGTDGISAYDVAVENGFVGTEAAWLLSLEGTDGTDGTDGAQGVPGPPGPASITWEPTLTQNLVTGTYSPIFSLGGSSSAAYVSNDVHWSLTPDVIFIDIDVRFSLTCQVGEVGRFEINLSAYIPNIIGAAGNCVLMFRAVNNTWEAQQAVYAELTPITGMLTTDFVAMKRIEAGGNYDFKGQIIVRI